MAIRGVVFDKDGTLFDFTATWADWAKRLLSDLTGADGARTAALARAIGFDPETPAFLPGSPVIAATPDEIAAAMLPHLPDLTQDALTDRIDREAARTVPVPAVPLAAVLHRLRSAGLRLGVATNDAAASARAHLAAHGVEAMFDLVAGYDSGFGGKPGPGMLLAFAERTGLRPEEVLMVGDSTHDLAAAAAAGMPAVAVLTGPAGAEELAPHALAVLPDIGHLPDWIAGTGSESRSGA